MTGKAADVPSFSFPLPRAPLAGAVTRIGKVSVAVRLALDGVLDVTCPGGPDRARALAALDALASGVFVQGMASPEPRISSDAGHRFRQLRSAHEPPSILAFEGVCRTDFERALDGVRIRVTGEVDYRLEVHATRESADGTDFGNELASIGGLVLIGTTISDHPELRDRLTAKP
ncbi:hypothetical protein [Amycolatopsis anabasis]|uniref:hypothetical protein n=1 Tax=Amycolatopsis anabasis TaxID=1840409 RepID=UPI00131BCA82|nr:hypothetical protein [Amycolatopsis anabasis]